MSPACCIGSLNCASPYKAYRPLHQKLSQLYQSRPYTVLRKSSKMDLPYWTMSEQTITPYAIKLTDASQWHIWIDIVRSIAKITGIWDLVDPSLEQEPPHIKPSLPKKVDIRADNETTRSHIYTDLMAQFHQDNKEYWERRKYLRETLAAIRLSVSEVYLMYILDKSSPWQALRALQQRIEPEYRMFVALQQQRSNGRNSRARAVGKTRVALKRRQRC